MNVLEMNSTANNVCGLMTLLSNKSRLMILCLLTEGEKLVGELAGAVGARDTAVSQQLAVLRREQVVKPRRQGQTMFYRIVDPKVSKVLEFLYAKYCGLAAVGKESSYDAQDN